MEVESLGTAARRLLAGLERDAARKAMEKASGGLERPDQFQEKMPERSGRRTDNAQRSGKDRRGEEVATDHAAAVKGGSAIGIGCGQPDWCFPDFSFEGADDAGRPDRESFASADRAKIITLSVFRRGRSVPTPVANAPAGIVLVFPVGAAQASRMEW